jgi:hypothetical protein
MDGKRFASSATTTERPETAAFCATATRRPVPVQNYRAERGDPAAGCGWSVDHRDVDSW